MRLIRLQVGKHPQNMIGSTLVQPGWVEAGMTLMVIRQYSFQRAVQESLRNETN